MRNWQKISVILSIAASFIFMSATSFGDEDPKLVTIDYGKAYVPNGFDSNDKSEIVVEGTFRNSCFRPAGAKATVDPRTNEVYVQGYAYEYRDRLCTFMLVPFSEVVDLGILKEGGYVIKQKVGVETLGGLSIRAATVSTPDDFLYAPVGQTFFEKVDGAHQLKITGAFSSSCTSMTEVKVDVQKDVIVVQPITEYKDDGECKDGGYPFSETVELKDLDRGRYLIHVRSLNGKSVNELVDVR